MSSCMLFRLRVTVRLKADTTTTLPRFSHHVSGRARQVTSICRRDKDERRPIPGPDLRPMTERDEIVRFSLRAGKNKERDVLPVHAVHHVRYESIAAQASPCADKLDVVVCR